MQKEWLLWLRFCTELKQTVLNSWYVKTMGMCPFLEIATKNQNLRKLEDSSSVSINSFISCNDSLLAGKTLPKTRFTVLLSCSGELAVHSCPLQVGFFRPNFRNLASFQVSWPKKNYLAFWPHLNLVGRKKFVSPFGSFMSFLRWKIFLWRKILLFHFFRQHICKTFLINAILDRHLRSDVSNIWGMWTSN